MCLEETGQVKNCLGKCSFKVTRPDGECSKIFVSNPDMWAVYKIKVIFTLPPS